MDASAATVSYAALDVDRIRGSARPLQIGSDLRYFTAVDSTNRVARDLPAGNWCSGTVVVTEFQEAGRGRRGRTWIAPPGSSLLVSVLLRAPVRALPSHGAMMAALAAADAIAETSGLTCRFKWPNDLLIGERKVGGILAESARQGNVTRLILGLGINVNFDPGADTAIEGAPTSLQRELGRPVSRELLAIGLFKRCDLWYGYLTRDPDRIFAEWTSRLITLGRPVLVYDTSGSWRGVATGVERDGGLLVRDDDGKVRTIYAADVSIRQPGGGTSP